MADYLVIKKVSELMKEGEEFARVTTVKAEGSTPRKVGAKMIVTGKGVIYGTIGGGVLENHIKEVSMKAIEEGKDKAIYIELNMKELDMICGGKVDLFIEIYKNYPTLLIIGAGHIGQALYNIASTLNFDIVMFDDREEFLTYEKYPKAKELILGPIDMELKNYNIQENSYVVIVSRGHEYDESALAQVIDLNLKYIGVIGSKRKVKIMMDNLRSKGIKDESIKRVYSPIGINISSGSPEEVAISIISEILLVKNNGILEHMKLDYED